VPIASRRPCQIALLARYIPQVAQLKRLEVGAAQLSRQRQRLDMQRFRMCQVAQMEMRLTQVAKGAGNLA
jgi:hypothetical protein